MKKKNQKLTVITEGGWKYTGILDTLHMSLFGSVLWLKLKTNNGNVRINGRYIVSIIENQ